MLRKRIRTAAAVCVFVTGAAATAIAAGESALIEAVKAGDRQTVRTLLTRTPDVQAAEADGTTALHWAVRADDIETVGLLLRAGATRRRPTASASRR